MKAIDELRGFLNKSPSVVYPGEVLWYVDAIERELEERYIEGPKGADGRPVRYGGYVKVYPYDGSKRKVKALCRSGFGWKAIFVDGDEESLYRVVSCEPPTVDDEIRSIVQLCFNIKERGERWSVDDVMQSGNVSDVVAKLRLREESE